MMLYWKAKLSASGLEPGTGGKPHEPSDQPVRKKIELVMSNNDEMALGAVEAYRKAGYVREEWPVIFGIDGLEEALEAVKAGEMQGSILNDRVDQAKKMAKMAVELFEGEEFDQESLKEGRYYFQNIRR